MINTHNPSGKPGLAPIAMIACLAVLSASACDPSQDRVTVENHCGYALTVLAAESSVDDTSDAAVRAEASFAGTLIADGESISASLVRGAGGYLIAAVSQSGGVWSRWVSAEEEQREFVLTPETGTCPTE